VSKAGAVLLEQENIILCFVGGTVCKNHGHASEDAMMLYSGLQHLAMHVNQQANAGPQ